MAARENGITSFGLRNFKAFHYLEDVELKPLTLLVGANSSGKSSIFQSLLLLKQSLLSGTGGGPLKFDGEWVRLGGFAQVVSNFDVSRKLEYRFTAKSLAPSEELFDQAIRGRIRAKKSTSQNHRARLSEAATSAGRNSNRQLVPVQMDICIGLTCSSNDGSALVDEITLNLSGPGIDPGDSRIRIGRSDAEILGQEIVVNDQLRALVFDKFLPQLSPFAVLGTLGAKSLSLSKVLVQEAALRELRRDLSTRLDYLGPVRADPRPFCPVSDDPAIGARGEGAVPYLLRRRDEPVRFFPGITSAPQEAGLFQAVNHWLRQMRVVEGITIDPVESIAYTAAVSTPLVKSRPVNLSQVGFGVSQILPVLIQGLRNPKDAWILFEQPEIHLHPRLQGELGDFFLACARAGKTLMVETHSDHLVHRIRRRIAEDTTGELASMVQILFVHAGTEANPGSYVEPLRVSPDGSIENWPDDFLQDAADEAWAILRARQARSKQAPP